jgi:hypothetical protein
MDSMKSAMGYVTSNLCFASDLIYKLRSEFRCVSVTKCRCTIFKHDRTSYTELVFLHPVGHVVHSSAFEAQNIDTLFFVLGWIQYGFHKMRVGTCYAELLFFALFFMVGWDRYGFDKKCTRTRYAEHAFL